MDSKEITVVFNSHGDSTTRTVCVDYDNGDTLPEKTAEALARLLFDAIEFRRWIPEVLSLMILDLREYRRIEGFDDEVLTKLQEEASAILSAMGKNPYDDSQ